MPEKKDRKKGVPSEKPQSEGQVLFGEALSRLESVFRDPLIPAAFQKRLLDQLHNGHTILVSDSGQNDNFIQKASQRVGGIIPPSEAVAQAKAEFGKVNAFYLAPKRNGDVGNIYMRQSYADENAMSSHLGLDTRERAKDNVTELLLEEFAHSLSEQSTVSLTDVEESSLILNPFRTKSDYLNQLQSIAAAARLKGVAIPEFSEADVVLRKRGFSMTSLVSGKDFGRFVQQLLTEEARASVLQTVLTIVAYGNEDYTSGKYPQVAPENRDAYVFALGVRSIFNRAMAVSLQRKGAAGEEMYIRELQALDFLRVYFSYFGTDIDNPDTMDSGKLRGQIEKLFQDLSTMSLDEFVKQPPEIVAAFLKPISGAGIEFSRRGRF